MTTVAPVLEFTTDSARALGFHDGQQARAKFLDTGEITIPDALGYEIRTRKALIAYHQGFILGRLGCESAHPRCPVCQRRHEVT